MRSEGPFLLSHHQSFSGEVQHVAISVLALLLGSGMYYSANAY